jgi:hypothetical protein
MSAVVQAPPLGISLQPFLPVSRAAVSMSEGENLDARIPFPVGDCKKEPLQHKSVGAVLAGWPTPGRLHHQGYGAIYFSNKFPSGRLTPLQVPLHSRLQFCKRGGMDLDLPTGH